MCRYFPGQLNAYILTALIARFAAGTGDSSRAAAAAAAARKSGDGGTAELAAATVWLSATVEAEQLSGVSRTEMLTDWRIVIAPPLVLDNQLPLRGSFLIWERPKVIVGQSQMCTL